MNLLQNTYIDRSKLGTYASPKFNNSNYRNHLIVKSDVERVQKDEGTSEVVRKIPHNLGYVPSVLVYGSVDGRVNYIRLPYNRIKANQFSENFLVNVNEQNLIITLQSADTAGILPASAMDVYIKYYIFRERAK